MIPPDDFPRVRSALLRWYARHKRAMPWRGAKDPYAVWVSEIMLQQTQVATVTPYFLQFMERFPTVERLAAASVHDVLKVWEGLGYYRRAHHLHRAAKVLVSGYAGRLPESAEALRHLPGIGRYTAGAIASIAFNADEPVLDGNVIRVFCRLFRIRSNPKSSATQKKLWATARALLSKGRAGAFNQALMDLGATVCTPRDPDCGRCPVRAWCAAFATGEQERLPRRATSRTVPHYDVGVAVIRRGSRFLIDQRRDDDPLGGGLWEFPGGKRHDGEAMEACVVREVKEELGLDVRPEALLCRVKHTYSHFRVTLHAYACRCDRGRPKMHECQAVRWVEFHELDRYAFPAGTHKILAALRGAEDARL